MRIAIQAADLDHTRIDGTRVYLKNLLERFGKISCGDQFIIYHKKDFNPELAPPVSPNYLLRRPQFPFFWTQTSFAISLFKDNPDCLWMPMHNLPLARRRKLKTTVTIHDLAFKYFPDHFPRKTLTRLNLLAWLAVKYSDKLIAVSNSTKRDILRFYPETKENKIKVIFHGFNVVPSAESKDLYQCDKKKASNYVTTGRYLLYVGAIQPRKNLETLIRAFEIFKKNGPKDFKLIIAGEKAWLWQKTFEILKKSSCCDDIIITGTVSFSDIADFYKNAEAFIFPSLYEGFGLPVLEAMAAGVPVICQSNSSLPEVAGNAALYFEKNSAEDLACKIKKLIEDNDLRQNIIHRGHEQIKKFSWDKCARETLDWIKQ